MFSGEYPIGQTMELKGDAYVVVGIVELSNNSLPKVDTLEDWYTYYGNESAGKILFLKMYETYAVFL